MLSQSVISSLLYSLNGARSITNALAGSNIGNNNYGIDVRLMAEMPKLLKEFKIAGVILEFVQ